MDSDYSIIADEIDRQASSFYIYLQQFLLDDVSWKTLQLISKQARVYIFSGVIRNFLLGYLENRDLDIVIDADKSIHIPKSLLRNIEWKRNSFGGLKVRINSLNVDFWNIKDTWGIIKEGKPSNAISLISTAFFNFSSIAYDFNSRCFVYGKDFLRFMYFNCMDIVYAKNPNIPLCIVNTIYYFEKYGFGISNNLGIWFISNYDRRYNYNDVQIGHWGEVRYSKEEINKFYNFILLRVS